MRNYTRIDERHSLPLEVQWESLSGKHEARISDISLGGCFMESLAQVSIGEEVHFEIQLPTGGRMPLRGEVIHRQSNLGFGLRFADLSMMERNMLAHVISELRQS
jgi:c-di-GMP-binding flagellar brake protein YcgR